MFEKVLQNDETIRLHTECVYCGDGAMASVKNGYAILTDKRFIVCKKKATALPIILGIAIFVAVYAGVAFTTGIFLGAIPGAGLGALSVVLGSVLSKAFAKGAEKPPETTEYSIDLGDIASVENGNRGVVKMLVIKTNGGGICKINPKAKSSIEEWRDALKA